MHTAGTAASGSPPDLASLHVALNTVVTGLESPIGVVNSGDGSRRLFIVEQGGRIGIVRDGRLIDAPFLDIANRVSAGGERGLLGLAFHPGFPRDARFFVDYTDTDGNTVVASFSVPTAAADEADPGSEQVLLHIEQPFANHNGGQLAFGADGMLYMGMGDGGGAGDPHGNGQRTDTLLGKILRIDVDHPSSDRPYGIPADNPFAKAGGMPEIWALGLRNPWRFSFDSLTHDLWIGDVGQGQWEEIDHQRAGTGAGANYGWNVMEGDHCYATGQQCDPSRFVAPVAEYGHDVGCAVTGGYVGRGSAPGDAGLRGVYVFGDYCSGRIWGLDAAGAAGVRPTLLLESGRQISSFGQDASGALYLTDLTRGELVRLTAAP